ncbi:MAG: hypothetical protein ACP5OA_04680 [Candidatus Woesearchaeota archaeon]
MIKIANRRSQPDYNNIFSRPQFDLPDYSGGLQGKKEDCTLEGKIPQEFLCDYHDFFMKNKNTTENAKSANDYDKNAASRIKKNVQDYYTTYLN